MIYPLKRALLYDTQLFVPNQPIEVLFRWNGNQLGRYSKSPCEDF